MKRLQGFLVLICAIYGIKCQSNEVTYQKCCPENQVIDFSTKKCVYILSDFEEANEVNINLKEVDAKNVTIKSYGFPKCVGGAKNQSFIKTNFETFLNEESELILRDLRLLRNHSAFCIDQNYNETDENEGDSDQSLSVAIACEIPDEIFCEDSTNTCVQMCCPYGQFWSYLQESCVPYESGIGESQWLPKSVLEAQEKGNARVMYDSYPKCEAYTEPQERRLLDVVLPNGYLDVGYFEKDCKTVPYHSYCVSYLENQTENGKFRFNIEYDICISSVKEENGWGNTVEYKLYSGLFIVSMVFLALLFGFVFHTQREKLFGCMMMSTILMLFTRYLILTILKLQLTFHSEDTEYYEYDDDAEYNEDFEQEHQGKSQGLCEFEALILQFTEISAIFWLNAMSHAVWSSFRSLQTVSRNFTTPKLGIFDKKFKWYALYAWGGPLVVSIVTILIQRLTTNPETANHFTPLIDVENDVCTIREGFAPLFYIHIITGPVLIVTCYFFTMFIWNMCCGVFAQGPAIEDENNKRLKAIVKMFFVMGPTWLAEILHFALSQGVKQCHVNKVVILFDLINCLQGFFMFCAIYFDTNRIYYLINLFRKHILKKEPISIRNDRKSTIGMKTITREKSSESATSVVSISKDDK